MGNKSSKKLQGSERIAQENNELVVYGYIRHERYSLSVCIPNKIYRICLQYFNNFVQEFYRYASDIVFAVAKESLSSEQPINLIQILTRLKDICIKLLENKTQTVNLNDINIDRIPQTPFLHLLGFKSINTKQPMQLICSIPNIQKCENAISVLNNFIFQFDGKSNSLSLKQIILQSMQYENEIIMETLFMSYILFTDSITLLTQLRNVYENNTKQRNIVLKILTYWMHSYFQEDFCNNSQTQHELITNWFSFEIIKNEFNTLNTKPEKEIKEEEFDTELKDKSILDYSVQIIAEQVTLIQKKLLNNIRARECIDQNWKPKKAYVFAPNILKAIAIFNEFTILIQVELFKQNNLKQRSKTLNRLIEMGECFRGLQNYYGLCIVYSALNASSVLRLKHLWAKISKKNKKIFEDWKGIFSTNIRYLQIRQGSDSCIPHIAIFLGDFVSIDERRKLVYKDKIKDVNEKINFNVMLQIVDRIKHLQSYQSEYSYSYLIGDKIVQYVITYNLMKYKDLKNDEIWAMSTKSKQCDENDV
eukprot:230740_1